MKRNVSLAVLLLAWLAVSTGCAGGAPMPGGSQADRGPSESKTPEQGGREETSASGVAVGGCALGFSGPEPSRGAPGEAFRVRGEGFTTDCYDTGQPGRPPPQRGIPIDLRQGERTWRLATVDADPQGVLDAELRVPDDAESGSAAVVVRTDDGYPVESPFRVLDGPKAARGLPETSSPEPGDPGVANGEQEQPVASGVAAACAAGTPVDLVAEGTVERVGAGPDPSLAEVRLDRVLEGDAEGTIVVRTGSGDGAVSEYDLGFEDGGRYLLRLQREGNGAYTTNLCLGSERLE